MTEFLAQLYSWSFLSGVLIGLVGQRVFDVLHARWLDKHRPLENGDRHKVHRMSPQWIVGAITIAVLGWIVFQVQATSEKTEEIVANQTAFAEETLKCQRQFNAALRQRSLLNTEDSKLATIEREALRNWINTLLHPPTHIAKLTINDPIRHQWGMDITLEYSNVIEDAKKEREANEVKRQLNPIPEPMCGKNGNGK